jgi:hypothetical protein
MNVIARLRTLLAMHVIATSCIAGLSTATSNELRGTVRDASTRQPLSAAILRVLGTSRGTIANTNGEFVILLPPGGYRIAVSSVGYHPDTLQIRIPEEVRHDVELVQSAIVLAEIVVTSEDPAMEIMRRVIERKKRWLGKLNTYTIDAFTRQTIFRDTAIAAIAESFTNGYWQRGDTLREIVRQKRQTSNIETAQNFASVGRILNFNDDRIRFVGYSFVGPTAEDAFEYYNYVLLHTHRTGAHDVFQIAVIPRTKSRPLFKGTVSIAGDSYALMGVDVEPNEAFVVPLVKDRQLRYKQEFSLYDQEFWLPADIRIEGAFTVSALGFKLPRIGIEQTSVITNYQINLPLPDTIFQKSRLTVDSSATKYDSTFWASTAILPLNVREQSAYATLDSSQKLDVQFRPTGITATLGGSAGGAAGSVLKVLDLSFNRVEGLHIGLKYNSETLVPWIAFQGRLAYGFSDRSATYLFGATFFPSITRVLGIGWEIYRSVDSRPEGGYYGPLFNTLTALFAKNDYSDYYRAEGWRIHVESTPSKKLRGRLSLVSEEHRTTAQRTDFSLLYTSRSYRANPQIEDGNLRALCADLSIGDEPVPLDLVSRNSLDLSVEHSSPSVASSSFDYTRYSAAGTLVLTTFGESFLFRPYLKIRITAGGSRGILPPQRWFSVDSRSTGFAPFGVFRTFGVKEFSGSGLLAIMAEHNFRSIPFLALGVPFLYEPGIELIIHGGAVRSWSGAVHLPNGMNGWEGELGFGISRILDVFRLDCSWRLTGSRVFCITGGIANIL